MFKPTFTPTPANTAFGGTFGTNNASSPFGQTSFNKPQTAFGTTSAFGSSPASMFSNQPMPSGSLFGGAGTSFGPQPTQSAFGFGATNTATTNPFGQPQQPPGGGLFGSSGSSAFGQQNKSATFSGFGSSSGSSLFGAQPAQPSAAQPFGTPSAAQAGGLFGQSGPFGGSTITGTIIRFNPVTGTDSINKNNLTQSINTRHNCITCMKEYESKSLEELRLEDYMVNRKGPQQSTNGLFGGVSQQIGSGLFGSAQSTGNAPAFGTSAPSFGSAGGSGLFGGKPTVFGAPTTSSSPFSFGPSTATPFGAPANKPFGAGPSSSTLFPTAATQPSGAFVSTGSTFGGFGTQASNAGSSFFGQPKPTVSFGAPSTIGAGFGVAQQQTATNLFGAAKQPPAPAFGTSTFGSAPSGTGFGSNAFGQPQQQQQQTSLFGSFGKPSGTTFGSQQIGAFGSQQQGSSLFANKPISLFSQPSNQSAFGTSFASNLNAFASPPFGQNTVGCIFQNQQKISPTIQPIQSDVHERLIMTAPQFPKIDILEGLTPARDVSLPLIVTKPAAIDEIVKTSMRTDSKSSPRYKLRMSTVKEKTLFGGVEAYDSSFEGQLSPQRRHPRKLVLRTRNEDVIGTVANTAVDEIDEICYQAANEAAELDKQQSRNYTWILRPRYLQFEGSSTTSTVSDKNVIVDTPSVSSVDKTESGSTIVDVDINEKSSTTTYVISADPKGSDLVQEKSKIEESDRISLNVSTPQSQSSSSESVYTTPPHPVVHLTRAGYYTIPSLEELESITAPDGTCIVDGFTVGRTGYGNVYFPDEFDVSGLDLDKIVHIRNKEIILYPDEEEKPLIGQGLNRKAQVTIDQVYPRDKTVHSVISDVNRLIVQDFEGMLRRNCEADGSQFIEYRPETGSWVFKVDHFTRYGLLDEYAYLPSVEQTTEQDSVDPGLGGWSAEQHRKFASETAVTEALSNNLHTQMVDIGINTETNENVFEYSRIVDIADLGILSEKKCIQDKKSSLKLRGTLLEKIHGTEDYNTVNLLSEEEPIGTRALRIAKNTKVVFPAESEIAPPIKPKNVQERVAMYIERVLNLRVTADVALYQGYNFKVKWAPRSQISYSLCDISNISFNSKPLNMPLHDPVKFPPSYNILQIKIDEYRYDLRIREHLKAQLRNDIVLDKKYHFPYIKPRKGTESLLVHEEVAKKYVNSVSVSQYSLLLWTLLASLWSETIAVDDSEEKSDHYCVMTRREYIEEWFKSAVKMTTCKTSTKDSEVIWNHITRHELTEACETAVNADRYNLAMLIALVRSDKETRTAVKKQLDVWKSSFSDDLIDELSIKVVMLVAGISHISLPSGDINVCENLSWVEAFALHFWYLSKGNESISDIVKLYEKAFEGNEQKYSLPPVPIYTKLHTLFPLSLSASQFDSLYHIFKLYGDKSYPLEKIIDPSNHTDSPLDYSLSWFVMETFEAIGFGEPNIKIKSNIHFSFAAQLERAGAWHWAVYVLLHIEDIITRKNAVFDIIERNVATRDEDSMYDEKEKFVIEKLKVPRELFLRGEATVAIANNEHNEAIIRMIFTTDLVNTERIFRKVIVPMELVNENKKYLCFLFKIIVYKHQKNKNFKLREAFHKYLIHISGKGCPPSPSYDDTIVARLERKNYAIETFMRQIVHCDTFNKRKHTAVEGEESLAALVNLLSEMCVPSDYKLAQVQMLAGIHLENLLAKVQLEVPYLDPNKIFKKK